MFGLHYGTGLAGPRHGIGHFDFALAREENILRSDISDFIVAISS